MREERGWTATTKTTHLSLHKRTWLGRQAVTRRDNSFFGEGLVWDCFEDYEKLVKIHLGNIWIADVDINDKMRK